MTKHEIQEDYFQWIYERVIDPNLLHNSQMSYTKLLRRLHEIPFTYILAMDENREADGIDLRYKFGYECRVPEILIANALDMKPCSVLEMMAALAMRCEDTIMTNPEYGDRTAEWFYDMLVSLQLDFQYNGRFSRAEVDKRIDIFLKRKYARDGWGGLFTVHKPQYDLRTIDIWYQAMWYLKEKMEE